MLDFTVYNEFPGQIVTWVPNPQTEHAVALRARRRAQIGRTLKWAVLLWQEGILYGSALSSSSVVEQKVHGSHLPIDSRDPPPCHDALSCRGGVGGGVGNRCGACLPAFKLQLRNKEGNDDDLQMRRESAVPTSRNQFDVATKRTMLSACLVSAFETFHFFSATNHVKLWNLG